MKTRIHNIRRQFGEAIRWVFAFNGLSQGGPPILLGACIGALALFWGAAIAIGQTVSVTANPLWTDSGLNVTNGQTVTITASGSWSFDTAVGYFGPDGDPDWPPTYDGFFTGANEGELIAYVGSDPYQGSWGNGGFFPQSSGYWTIGYGDSFTSPVSGELWLGINDDAVTKNIDDNAGSVTAKILGFSLVADSLSWSTNTGVDFAYSLQTGPLPAATDAELFWAGGPDAADIISSTPIYSVPIPADFTAGVTNEVHVPDSYFQNPPNGATYIILEVGPENVTANSVLALQIPPVPQVTFNRVIENLAPFTGHGDLVFSPRDGIDDPLGVAANADILAVNSGPQTQVQGLVADGVTPLLFAVSLPMAADSPIDYQVSFNVNGSGSLLDLVTNFYVLGDDGWMQSTNLIISGSSAYAYVSGLKAEDLAAAFGAANQLAVQVNFTPIGSVAPVANATFYIRRPPVILVHGYNADASTWSQDFLNTLQQNVPADFIIPINYGVNFARKNPDYDNTYDSLADLVRQLDPQLDQAFAACQTNWACTRYDVIAHSQGGVLTRMLCQTNQLGASAFGASRPPVSTSDFYRGRFRRVVTIGSPQNGSLLLRYVLDILNTVPQLEPQTYLNQWGLDFLIQGGGIIQEKFDPFGPQIAAANDATDFPMDSRIKFDCVQATVKSSNTNSLLFWANCVCYGASIGLHIPTIAFAFGFGPGRGFCERGRRYRNKRLCIYGC